MKFLFAQIPHLLTERSNRVNAVGLLRFFLVLVIMITAYSVIFHFIMEYEGRSQTWVTGFYWTLTVMSTLGFGDIIFQSDLGKIFSVVVLLSGIVFLLILLPFTFIELFYEPWMRAQQAARAPTSLPAKTSGHIILTHFDPVTKSFIRRLEQYGFPYVLLVASLQEALDLHNQGYKIMRGYLDNPKTYDFAQAHQARLVVATASDQVNANIVSTVREVSETVPVISTANFHASVDILELAGSTHVLELGEMMGQALARRVLDNERLTHPIGQFGELIIAEAMVRNTSLVGQTLKESRLRELAGINVLGIWQDGVFQPTQPETAIAEDTVLVIAGSEDQIAQYNRVFFQTTNPLDGPVVIIGGGRVGRAAAQALAARNMDYRIIEKDPARIRNSQKYILGDAAEIELLVEAGIHQTPAVIITTHDDDMNIYLTIYCRRLRPDVQIVSRANLERNDATLHRAGADFVLSYASTGANTMINLISRENILMVAEGLDIFEVDTPDSLVGKTLAETDIRRKTGCTVVGLQQDGRLHTTPDPFRPLQDNDHLVLIGSPEAEKRFRKLYGR